MEKLIFCQKGFHKANTEVGFHRHSCHEIVLYGYNAKGITVIGGKAYNFKAGDIALIPAETEHNEGYFADGGVTFFGFISDEIPPAGIYSNLEFLQNDINRLFEELVNQPPHFKKMAGHIIGQILICLFREKTAEVASVKDISYCKSFLDENFGDNITIASLAASVGYSADHLRHLFYKKYGISPKGYLTQKRLENAAEMLIKTNKSCTEIAYLCGFFDSGQLSREIKKRYGVSPLGLRKGN